tara:strand:- start:37007 stop:37702 length:696 start_codon:yes stop_codon:yes gene_type:complete
MDKNDNIKKINKGNIDSYYEIINTKIDDYFTKNVSASSLSKYFSKDYGLDKFIKREKLEDVAGIKRVIKDVVEDRMALDENVRTFEQFNSNSDQFKISYEITQDIEKQIADLYRVSLGHIESNKNRIKLKGVKNEQELYVFTKDNIRTVFINIAHNMYDVFTKEMKLDYSPLEIKVDIDPDIIDKEKFVNSFYNNINGKMELIEELLYVETGNEYKHKKLENSDIIIFEKE